MRKIINLIIICFFVFICIIAMIGCKENKNVLEYFVVYSRCYDNYAELLEFGLDSKDCDRTILDKDGVMARIFDSNQKLKKQYANSDKLNILKEYDDEFFVNNSILIIFGLIGDGNFDHVVQSIAIKNETMIMNIEYSEQKSTANGLYCIVIEIDKKDIKGVSKLEIINNADNDDKFNNIKKEAKQTYLKSCIQNNYPNGTLSDVSFRPFLGIYGEALVAQFYGGQYHGVWPDEEQHYNIGGLIFNIPTGYPILVWKDSKIFELSTAYDKGFLTKEDLLDIYNLYLIL